jgi:hypothetical protein
VVSPKEASEGRPGPGVSSMLAGDGSPVVGRGMPTPAANETNSDVKKVDGRGSIVSFNVHINWYSREVDEVV